MSSHNHRGVARLDRVPLPVEAARIGATGWQLTRTAARTLTKLPGKGPVQQKVIKQLPQTFADLGPTYVKFGQIIASSPGAFGEQLSREFRSLLDRVPPADTKEVHKLFADELGGQPSELFANFDEKRGWHAVCRGGGGRRPAGVVRRLRGGAVRVCVDRPGALRHPEERR